MSDAPTITVFTDPNPCPRAEIVADVPPDAVSFTTWRTTPTDRAEVRGAVNALAASPVVYDYEIPFGVPVTYQTEYVDAAGVPSELSPSSPPVTIDDIDDVWLSDPLDPTTALAVTIGCHPTPTDRPAVLAAAWAQITRASNLTVLAIAGSARGVASAPIRRAPSAPFSVVTFTVGQAGALRGLLEQAVPLLVRRPPALWFVDSPLYAAAGDLTETPQLKTGRSVFTFDIESVLPPGATTVIFPRVYDDLLDEVNTYDELAQRFATYNAVVRGRVS